ncbi:MAG: shikimate kinase [Bacteroidota bacterium]
MQHPRELPYRIYLIGFMGSGKSHYGTHLAEALNYQFIDLDEAIVQKAGQTIPQIFSTQGEAAFRQIEKQVVQESTQTTRIVYATGGGAPCFFDNLDQMKNGGVVLYLKAEPELLVQRLQNEQDGRPLLQGKTKLELTQFIEQKLMERRSFYEQAHAIIHISSNADPIVDWMIQFLKFV